MADATWSGTVGDTIDYEVEIDAGTGDKTLVLATWVLTGATSGISGGFDVVGYQPPGYNPLEDGGSGSNSGDTGTVASGTGTLTVPGPAAVVVASFYVPTAGLAAGSYTLTLTVTPSAGQAIVRTIAVTLAAGIVVGTFVDYLLIWSAPSQLYYVGMNVPIKFALTRADGAGIVLVDADTLTLSVTLPSGATEDAGTLQVSSVSAPSIEIAAEFAFAVKDTHVFQLTLLHDGQELIARKTLIVY